MEGLRLTPTSYVVLGLIESMQPATAYDLKVAARLGVSNLWALPHTQLYSECARLAQAGLLDEEREPSGRRRRIYRLATAGVAALDEWRGDPTPPVWELRDAGLLKLFFGSDPQSLATEQLEAHGRRLAEYEGMREAAGPDTPRGMVLALDAGIGHEREYLRFWSALADGREP
jgi:PadR family transcriptional regulator AphA